MSDEKISAQSLLKNGPVICSKYRHYKGGIYEVIELAIFENTLTPMVIYRNADGTAWARTFDDWNATVDVDGKSVKRFTLID